MITNPTSALAPLDAVGPAVRALESNGTAEEVASAVRAVAAGIDPSLRLLLRADGGTPEETRMTALSPDALPPARVIEQLRDRSLISLELAGTVHELLRAVDRSVAGDGRPRGVDSARRAARRLREEVMALEAASAGRITRRSARSHSRARTVHRVPPPWPGSRRRLVTAVLVLALAAAGGLTLLGRSDDGAMADAIAAFRAGRLDAAATGFGEVVTDDPDNVTARLYLARVHRRQARYGQAAEALRAAARIAPDDPDIRRELGYLFLDLRRPASAAGQFDVALELEPAEPRNWIGLIRSLRVAGDPRSDSVLRRAPAEVRAVMVGRG